MNCRCMQTECCSKMTEVVYRVSFTICEEQEKACIWRMKKYRNRQKKKTWNTFFFSLIDPSVDRFCAVSIIVWKVLTFFTSVDIAVFS